MWVNFCPWACQAVQGIWKGISIGVYCSQCCHSVIHTRKEGNLNELVIEGRTTQQRIPLKSKHSPGSYYPRRWWAALCSPCSVYASLIFLAAPHHWDSRSLRNRHTSLEEVVYSIQICFWWSLSIVSSSSPVGMHHLGWSKDRSTAYGLSTDHPHKNLGVCTIGVGETACSISKAVLTIIRVDTQDVAGSVQLCAG